jgi:hypothetical protein
MNYLHSINLMLYVTYFSIFIFIVRQARRADNLAPSISRLSKLCGSLNLSQPYRPPWPVTGIALTFIVVICILLRILANTMRDFRPRNTLCTLCTPEDHPKRVETCSVVFNVHKVLRGRKSLIVLGISLPYLLLALVA